MEGLSGQVAVVAGATRGAGRGIARALGEAGAFVYCTGRSATGHAKGMDRPETIEETAALIEQAGGRAVALRVDHTRDEEVAHLAQRVRNEAGRLDVLVNSIWRAAAYLAGDPKVGRKAGLIHFASDLAREYGFTDVDGRVPNFPLMLDAKVDAIASADEMDDDERSLMWARYCQIHQDPARRELATRLAKALALEDLGPGLAPATLP